MIFDLPVGALVLQIIAAYPVFQCLPDSIEVGQNGHTGI